MVAVPAVSAFTTAVTPSALSEAMAGWLLFHVTALLVALLGFTVAVRVNVPPSTRVVSPAGLMVTAVTGTAVSPVVSSSLLHATKVKNAAAHTSALAARVLNVFFITFCFLNCLTVELFI
jgi:hypothetical protein